MFFLLSHVLVAQKEKASLKELQAKIAGEMNVCSLSLFLHTRLWVWKLTPSSSSRFDPGKKNTTRPRLPLLRPRESYSCSLLLLLQRVFPSSSSSCHEKCLFLSLGLNFVPCPLLFPSLSLFSSFFFALRKMLCCFSHDLAPGLFLLPVKRLHGSRRRSSTRIRDKEKQESLIR